MYYYFKNIESKVHGKNTSEYMKRYSKNGQGHVNYSTGSVHKGKQNLVVQNQVLLVREAEKENKQAT